MTNMITKNEEIRMMKEIFDEYELEHEYIDEVFELSMFIRIKYPYRSTKLVKMLKVIADLIDMMPYEPTN